MDSSEPLQSLLTRTNQGKQSDISVRIDGFKDADFIVTSEPWEEFNSQRLLQKMADIMGVEFACFFSISNADPVQFSTVCSSGRINSWKISEAYYAQRVFWRVLESYQSKTILKSQFTLSCDEGRLLRLFQANNVYLTPVAIHSRNGVMIFGNDNGDWNQPFHAGKARLAKLLAQLGGGALLQAWQPDGVQASQLDVLLRLAEAFNADDPITSGHGWMLVEYAEAIMQKLGASPVMKKTVGLAALLHDIGKIGVPDPIIYKPGELDANEWRVMHKHSAIGAGIILFVSRLAGVAEIVRTHHERYDGSGYPSGLKRDAIPLGARVVGVVDTYDAMTRPRPYHPARSREEAIKEIIRCRGREFDPRVVDAFLTLV
jgi:HD-GYP domain-containing protein (c-di-GMP phosphodiesterase class II)